MYILYEDTLDEKSNMYIHIVLSKEGFIVGKSASGLTGTSWRDRLPVMSSDCCCRSLDLYSARREDDTFFIFSHFDLFLSNAQAILTSKVPK